MKFNIYEGLKNRDKSIRWGRAPLQSFPSLELAQSYESFLRLANVQKGMMFRYTYKIVEE